MNLNGIKTIMLIGLSHDSLFNHYRTNFKLNKFHGYSFSELDEMLPYEREIYVDMLITHLEEEKQSRDQ
jgi:hypothetical protein